MISSFRSRIVLHGRILPPGVNPVTPPGVLPATPRGRIPPSRSHVKKIGGQPAMGRAVQLLLAPAHLEKVQTSIHSSNNHR